MTAIVVAVVKDGLAHYVIAGPDGEPEQFAQLRVPDAFDVRQATEIGLGLVSALGLNGASSIAVNPPPRKRQAPAAIEPAQPVKRKPGRPPGGAVYPVTRDDVVRYVALHPGSMTSEIAAALLPGVNPKFARQAIDNRARPMLSTDPPRLSYEVTVPEGVGVHVARWYPV